MVRQVLVTGAAGFVGATLVRRLLEEGHRVHALLRPGTNTWRISGVADALVRHTLELCDADAVEHLVHRLQPEWVFHLAARGAYSWQSDAREMIDTNVHGTVNLVEACLRHGVLAFVNTGTSSEYGARDHAPDEDEALDPNSDYAVTKAAATWWCRMRARRARANLVTLRLYSVFGPFEDPRRLIPTLITEGLKGRLPRLVHPETARDFIYVDDVVEAYVRVAEHQGHEPGAVYNIGTGTQLTIRDVVDIARRTMAIASEPVWGSMPARSWDAATWVANVRRVTSTLDWRANTSFEDGLRRTITWLEGAPEAVHYQGPAMP